MPKDILESRKSLLLFGPLTIAGLYASSLYSYRLFHSLVEAFCTFVAFVLFLLAWNTRRIQDNRYVLFIGFAAFFFGVFDLVHAIANKGIGVFPGNNPGLSVQLWIAYRLIFSLSFLAAPFFITRTFNGAVVGAVYGAASVLLFAAIFSGIFPVCYIDGRGLTPFKIAAEYLIIAVLAASIVLLFRHRRAFDEQVQRQLVFALLLAIAAEIPFTVYRNPFDTANMIGHFFHLFSYVFIYRSLVVTSFLEPTHILYRNLKLSEEKIRESEARQRAIFDHSPALIFVKDLQGRYVVVNRKAAEGMQLRVEDMLGKTDRELFPRERADAFSAGDREVIEQGTVREEEEEVSVQDGARFFLEHKFPLRDDTGRIFAVAGIATDITERKKTALELKEARDKAVRERLRLETILQTIPSALIVFDAASKRITLQNHQILRMLGRPLDAENQELRIQEFNMARPDGAAFQPEELPGMRAIQSGELVSGIEMVMSRSDGSAITVVANAAPLRDERDAVIGAVIAFHDITGRKKAEQALQKAYEDLELRVAERTAELAVTVEALQAEVAVRLRTELELRGQSKLLEAFFGNSMTCLAILDRGLNFVRVNAAYAFKDGREPSFFIGKNHFALYPSDELQEKFEHVVRTGEPYVVFERPFVYPEQPERGVTYWDLSVEPLFDEQGKTEYLVFSLNEVTERKLAEKQLEESQQKLLETFESMSEGFFTLDRDWRFTYVNNEAMRIWKKGCEELTGRTLWEVAPGSRGTTFETQYRKAVAERVKVSFEARSPLIDVWVEVRAFPTSDGLAVYFHDITERKQAEEALHNYREHLEELVHERTAQLETTNNELKAFAYSVSHDLRAPLRSIDGFSSALAEEHAGALDETALDYLRRIRNAAGRMDQLIEAMLSLSRITGGELKRTQIDLSALAKSVVEDLEKSQPGRAVEIFIAPGLKADGDPAMTRIVLDNLLRNAWKFSEKRDRARIEFGLAPAFGKDAYYVKDNGAGFDMAHAHRLFSAFQRLHSTAEFPGLGIGLATVQRIIHRHGGRIWAEGAVGRGATFYFSLK